ncbi:MAG: DUF4837 family protein [Candidatus Eisenbacteria bacterium]
MKRFIARNGRPARNGDGQAAVSAGVALAVSSARAIAVCTAVSSVLLVALTLCTCSPKQLPALGPASLLTIVTNVPQNHESVSLIMTLFSKDIGTVDEEKAYTFEIFPPSKLRKQDDNRNVILLADLSRNDVVAKRATRLLGKKMVGLIMDGSADYAILRDVSALGQTLAIVAGPSERSLSELLKARGNRFFSDVDSIIIEGTKKLTFNMGDQRQMSDYLLSKYGWTIRIPRDFKVAEVEGGGLVKLVGSEPARLLFVYWKEAERETLDARYCLLQRAKVAFAYYDEDEIDHSRTLTRNVSFNGRTVVRIEGVWQNEKYVIGGPFFSYCFLDGGRFYIVDCVLFAPGMEKASWLKQLDAIARTFDTRGGETR